MRKWYKWLVIMGLVWLGGAGCQRDSAKDPARGSETPPAAEQAAGEAIAELQPGQDREFRANYDGSIQKYIIRLPGGFDGRVKHDMMIALHGHGADRHQFAESEIGEAKGVREAAARHKVIFVSPDYRARTSWMGPAAEADMLQIIRLLRKEYKIRKIFLVGGSMGGTSVLTFATLHPELMAGVCSMNGTANLLEYSVNFVGIQEAIKNSFGGRPEETPEEYKIRNAKEYRKRSAEFHPEKFTMPLAVTTSGRDEIVPPTSVQRLVEKVRRHNPRVLLIHRPEEGHITSYEDTVAAMEYILNPPDGTGRE